MRWNGILVTLYALLVLAGGMIGFAKADSIPSLVMGMIFSLGLLLSAVGMMKNSQLGCLGAVFLTSILTIFFVYRFILTQRLMPAGLMAVLSLMVLISLCLGHFLKNKNKSLG